MTELIAAVTAIASLVIVIYQTRLLRETLETANYQDILGKKLAVRAGLSSTPELAEVFEEHPDLTPALNKARVSVPQFFWILQYWTIWENFYRQRTKGLMDDATWAAYINTMSVVMRTPRIAALWREYAGAGTYRRDWTEFIDAILAGEAPADPAARR